MYEYFKYCDPEMDRGVYYPLDLTRLPNEMGRVAYVARREVNKEIQQPGHAF